MRFKLLILVTVGLPAARIIQYLILAFAGITIPKNTSHIYCRLCEAIPTAKNQSFRKHVFGLKRNCTVSRKAVSQIDGLTLFCGGERMQLRVLLRFRDSVAAHCESKLERLTDFLHATNQCEPEILRRNQL